MSSIALVDCNNFYASCERVFDPKLIGKPVVILSNNDGCIIARSQEAKKLGIPMGAPLFKWAEFIDRQRVVVRSSNFALYGNMSQRVMASLAHFNPEMEIYSVDEAFLLLDGISDPHAHCQTIREKVLQWTGIPVSIGIAETKTLCKIANHIAKRHPAYGGVCLLPPEKVDTVLNRLPVRDIWGIGRRLATHLHRHGIRTALQLKSQEDLWIKKHLSVTGLKTVWELRGIPCFAHEEVSTPKQSILTSRSFRSPLSEKEDLAKALAHFAARAGEKLREEESLASWLQLFILTSPHNHDTPFYSNRIHITLPQPTDYTPTLIQYAKKGLEQIYRSGYHYKRAGILLGELVPRHCFQQDLFCKQNLLNEEKQEAFISLLDYANGKFGYPILKFAAEGSRKRESNNRSPSFTTRWEELLTINI